MSSSHFCLTKETPATLEGITFTQNAFLAALQECLPLTQAQRVQIAICEAMANALRHGCQENPSKHIRSSLEVTESGNGVKITIVVTDEGAGFDPQKVADPALLRNLQQETGRGLAIMRFLMDTVTFNKKGNSVTMTKFLPPPAN